MTFTKTFAALATIGLLASTTMAFAQVGGSDVPTDAKKQGTMENGSSSTGMSKGEAKTPMSSEKGTATGGQPGGATSRQ